MKRPILLCIPALIIICTQIRFCYAADLPKWFDFSKKGALAEWEEKVFNKKVLYRAQASRQGWHLQANSDKSCSALLYRIKFDPKKYPMISWKWRVTKFPDKNKTKNTRGGWLEKDDYAARVYVIFPSWIFTKIKCIEYVWDETHAPGSVISSPYLSNIKLIVAESGKKPGEDWVAEEKNIYEDYKKAFGRYPGYVGAIALMTDSDNTSSSGEASYTAIRVGYKK